MSSYVGAKLQLDCGPSVGTFVGTIVDVSDEKLTLKNALRNGLPSDTGLVTLHRSSIVSITMLRSPGGEASDSTVSTASTTLQQVKDKENKIDHRVIEASLQEKTQQQQQQARREAARERLMSIPNATPVYICQNSPICPGKGGGGSGGNGQNGRHKGSEASKPKGINGSGDFTTSNGRSNKDRNLPVSPTGRRQVNSGGNPATHQHVRARSELVTNYISCVNNSIGATNNTTSSSSPTTPNGIAVDQSGSTVWFLANGDSDLRVPAVSDHFLETVLLAAEKLGLSMARMAECCGRSVADFLINQIASPYPLYQQTRQLNQLSLQSQQQQQHRQNLQFAVIIGGGRRGQFGLATARHLASRGASVCAYITATDPVDRDQLGQEIRLYRSTGCPLVEHSRDLPWILDCVLLASDQVDSPAHPLAQWFRASRAPLACLAPPAGNPACLSPRYNIHCCLPIAPSNTTAASSTISKLGANYLCDLGVTRDAFQAAGLRGFAPGGLFNLGSVVHLVPSLK